MRMNWRRLLVYLILNAAVSAVVTLSVLVIWDYTHRGPAGLPAATPISQPPLNQTSSASFATARAATATPTIYIVQPGDTLGSIALKYDVSLEDMMKANALADPNTLSVGQTLVIPVAGLPAATPTRRAPGPTQNLDLTPPPTGTVVSQTGEPQVAIRTITDPGNLSTERVTIVNLGTVVDLTGWTLSDAQGNVYTFPALSLFQGGAVTVHTALGRDTVTDLYWGKAEPIWQSGELASLKDPRGQVRASFNAP
jgi:LysM repeat protein